MLMRAQPDCTNEDVVKFHHVRELELVYIEPPDFGNVITSFRTAP